MDISKNGYLPFGLINKGLVRKYNFLLNQSFDTIQARKTILDYKDLDKKVDEKDFSYLYKTFNFNFPSDFIFVNPDFLDYINNYIPVNYRKDIRTILKAIVGGDCILLKDAKDSTDQKQYRYIILYQEIKENVGNEFDFFLYINNKKEREAADNYILTKNLWNYFKYISYNYKEEYKKIYNKYNQEVGYIVRCSDVSRIEDYYIKTNNKRQTLKNIKNIPNNKPNIISRSLTSMLQQSTIKINQEFALDPVISFFFQIDKLKNALGLNKNIDIQSFKKILLTNIETNIQKSKNYQQIFDLILTNIDPNMKKNKEYYNQSELYEREKGFKIFMEKHNKGNLIQKLFLIPIEEKIYCHKCGMSTYYFNYKKFILMKNPLQEMLFQKVFHPIKITSKKGKICNFCNGEETEYSIERKVIDYPEILIVIIEPNQINNYNLGLNAYITNGTNITYSLNKFIEFNTNTLYWIDNKSNNKHCHKFDKNKLGERELFDNKKPIVLFYNLIKIEVNKNNSQNKIQMPLSKISMNKINQNDEMNIKILPNFVPDFQNIINNNNNNIIQNNQNNNCIGNPNQNWQNALQQNFNFQNNNDFNNEIDILKQQLLQEKNNNEQLKKENQRLYDRIISLTQKNEVKINLLETEISKLKEKILNLEKEKNNM